MARPKKYPEELIARGVRIALESDRPIAHIAADLGIGSETLRKRVRQPDLLVALTSPAWRFAGAVPAR